MTQQLLKYIKNQLDAKLSMPIYLQLKQAIRCAIDEKILHHGSILPSERKMSQCLEISRVTVVKALTELLDEGLVIKRQGKGTVISIPVSYNLASGGFSSQLQHLGNVSNRWLVRELIPADAAVAKELEIDEGSHVSKIRRVRLVDDFPVSLETMYIPERFLPRPDLLEGSLYSWWAERGVYPDEQNYSLSVYSPTKEESQLLNLKESVPLMKLVLKSRDTRGVVLEYGTAYCLNDYFKFDFKVKYRAPVMK
ncbi:GntR family transcriptional regulator [Salmonella enterica]|nr:GntR family transcriptional regulator [Salmonella enterica]EDS5482526.1 GntR family transcriptional regulator [Salmonella enterica subsp. enterica serovar Panama]EGX9178985.1 GntR family transcriptional regulator [Salmonella enterica]EGZ6495610.1 GntR family transcriptional regulator [Salmonella enterica]EJG5924576.1 GntR family transcriptional regulator [Salmonella enterica]